MMIEDENLYAVRLISAACGQLQRISMYCGRIAHHIVRLS